MINIQVCFGKSYITSFFNPSLISDIQVSKQRLTDAVKKTLTEFVLKTFTDITTDDIQFDIRFYESINTINLDCAFWLLDNLIPINLFDPILSVVEDKSWVTEYDEYIIIYNTYNPIIMRSYSDGTVKIFNKEVGEGGDTTLVEQTSSRDRLFLKLICETAIDKLDSLDSVK